MTILSTLTNEELLTEFRDLLSQDLYAKELAERLKQKIDEFDKIMEAVRTIGD